MYILTLQTQAVHRKLKELVTSLEVKGLVSTSTGEDQATSNNNN